MTQINNTQVLLMTLLDFINTDFISPYGLEESK